MPTALWIPWAIGVVPAMQGLAAADDKQDLLAGHPRASNENVKNIDAMAAARCESASAPVESS